MKRVATVLRNRGVRFALVCTVALASSLLATAGWSQSLIWLGTLPGGSRSQAYGVSADGSVVVGGADNADGRGRAFRWENGFMQDIGSLLNHSVAYGVSADGSVVVGGASTDPTQRVFLRRAFRWTQVTGMQDLGTLGGDYSWAYGVSADGSVVVGWADYADGQYRAFRWVLTDPNTGAGVMQDLGTLPGSEGSVAHGVSADGSVVVGWADNAARLPRAFRWENGVMQDLGTLGGNLSRAYGVSADGSVVVGVADNTAGQERAFRWVLTDPNTGAGVMQDLGTLPNFDRSAAWDISADGSVVVGEVLNSTTRQFSAFRWTQATGMQDLNQLYASLLTGGSRLDRAYAISPNGRYIVGWGYNADTGRFEGYLLDTVPEPASLMALGAGLAGLLGMRRRKR